jgi:hypothetical protein
VTIPTPGFSAADVVVVVVVVGGKNGVRRGEDMDEIRDSNRIISPFWMAKQWLSLDWPR